MRLLFGDEFAKVTTLLIRKGTVLVLFTTFEKDG